MVSFEEHTTKSKKKNDLPPSDSDGDTSDEDGSDFDEEDDADEQDSDIEDPGTEGKRKQPRIPNAGPYQYDLPEVLAASNKFAFISTYLPREILLRAVHSTKDDQTKLAKMVDMVEPSYFTEILASTLNIQAHQLQELKDNQLTFRAKPTKAKERTSTKPYSPLLPPSDPPPEAQKRNGDAQTNKFNSSFETLAQGLLEDDPALPPAQRHLRDLLLKEELRKLEQEVKDHFIKEKVTQPTAGDFTMVTTRLNFNMLKRLSDQYPDLFLPASKSTSANRTDNKRSLESDDRKRIRGKIKAVFTQSTFHQHPLSLLYQIENFGKYLEKESGSASVWKEIVVEIEDQCASNANFQKILRIDSSAVLTTFDDIKAHFNKHADRLEAVKESYRALFSAIGLLTKRFNEGNNLNWERFLQELTWLRDMLSGAAEWQTLQSVVPILAMLGEMPSAQAAAERDKWANSLTPAKLDINALIGYITSGNDKHHYSQSSQDQFNIS